MSKRILIISNSFFPEISPRSFRTTELAKEFFRQGCHVTVLTNVHPQQQEFLAHYPIEIRDLGKQNWKPIPIFKSGFLNLFSRILSKLASWLIEYPSLEVMFLVRKAIKELSNYDVLISVAMPHVIHWGVASVHRKNWDLCKIWIADCGDPYMGQQNDSLKPPFYFKWIEKWVFKKVNYISVPTINSINGYYPEFHSKIKVIPQGFRFEDFKPYKGPRNFPFAFFGYAGSFIKGKRDPTEMLLFLNSIEVDYEFHIYTHITHLHYVEPFIKNNKRIKLYTYINRDNLLFEFSKMDFVVNFENVGKNQTPSKLIDYAIINKPILSIETGNLDKENVLRFLKGEYSQSLVIENPEQYRIENIATKFLSLK